MSDATTPIISHMCEQTEATQSSDRATRMAAGQKKQEDFVQSLVDKGHKCISIGERYPIQVFWCQKDVCIKKIDK
uniref:Uncharacterized protein n=1 Tax=viral metagenome TaxID=1070528 RepID=A0A6C0C9V8_9ZZZZ